MAAHRGRNKVAMKGFIVTGPRRRRRRVRPRPLIPYPGGKWYGRYAIVPKFPMLVSEMVSPFVGGGSVELEMVKRGTRVHASDNYEPLVNLYVQALKRPELLAGAVERWHPMTKDGFERALEEERGSVGNELEKAARWYSLVRSSYSGRILGYSIGNFSGHRARFTVEMVQRLREFNAPSLSVELKDWREALDEHRGVFAYLDPPYPCVGKELYAGHKEFDHEELRDYLVQRSTPWALSMNNVGVVRELYSGFNFHSLSWRRHIGGGNLGFLDELLITNY